MDSNVQLPYPVVDRDGIFGRDRDRAGIATFLAGTRIGRDVDLTGTGTGIGDRD